MQEKIFTVRGVPLVVATAGFLWLTWTGWAGLFEDRQAREKSAPGWTAVPEEAGGRENPWAYGSLSEAGRRMLAREWAAGRMEREPERWPLALVEEPLSANMRRQARAPLGYRHCPAPVLGDLSHAEAEGALWEHTGGSLEGFNRKEWKEARCVLSPIPGGGAWEWFYFRRKEAAPAETEGPLEVKEGG